MEAPCSPKTASVEASISRLERQGPVWGIKPRMESIAATSVTTDDSGSSHTNEGGKPKPLSRRHMGATRLGVDLGTMKYRASLLLRGLNWTGKARLCDDILTPCRRCRRCSTQSSVPSQRCRGHAVPPHRYSCEPRSGACYCPGLFPRTATASKEDTRKIRCVYRISSEVTCICAVSYQATSQCKCVADGPRNLWLSRKARREGTKSAPTHVHYEKRGRKTREAETNCAGVVSQRRPG